MNVSEYLIDFMSSLKTTTIFGISGGRIEHLFHSIYQSGKSVSLVTAKHESSAAAMADSYARTSNCIGVVATTSGAGALNLVSALAESYTENSSVLAIVGQPENNRELHGAFQETSGKNGTPNLISILKNVTRYCTVLNRPNDLPLILSEIYELLLVKRQGPAVLMIPQNLFNQTVEELKPKLKMTSSVKPQLIPKQTSLPEGPYVIVAGRGVLQQKAVAELYSLAEKLQCPVVTTPDGKSAFDNFSPFYAGSIGVMGNPSAFEAVSEATTIITAGAKLNETDLYETKKKMDGKAILVLGEHPLFSGNYNFISESITTGCQFLEKQLHFVRTKQLKGISYTTKTENLYVRMLAIIEKEIDPEANVSIDAGVTGAYVLHNLRVRSSNTFNIALGMAGMGFSFGTIIGAVKANGRKGILIAGDGSFYMSGFEIHTAIEMNLPILYIVFNNNSHKMCSHRESKFFREKSGNNDFFPAYIGKGFADMFPGLCSYDVNSTEELKNIFRETRMIVGPVLISINIEENEIPPYLPLSQGAV